MISFKVIKFICLVLTLAHWCDAKFYSRCEFARTLQSQGIKNLAHLGTWTCIADHESKFNTKAVNGNTGDYGILQISHYFWCSDSNTPGKGCSITCKSLLGDDITEDITCAKHIYAVTEKQKGNGFTAWTTYKAYCLGDQSNWIAGCGLNNEF